MSTKSILPVPVIEPSSPLAIARVSVVLALLRLANNNLCEVLGNHSSFLSAPERVAMMGATSALVTVMDSLRGKFPHTIG